MAVTIATVEHDHAEPADEVTKQVATRIVRALEATGVSQGQVERDAKLSKGYLSRLRKAARGDVGVSTVVRIAHALGVRPCWLATGEGEMMYGPRGEQSAIVRYVELDDPYPNRRELRLLREWEKAAEPVKSYLLDKRHYAGDLDSVDEWLIELRRAEKRHARGELSIRRGDERIDVKDDG
jgi:transcriptional regulator with XRE-family HTH domain